MVTIAVRTNQPVTIRGRGTSKPGSALRIGFGADRPLAELAELLGIPADRLRLVSGGKGLELGKSLSAQGIRGKDTLYLLDSLPEGVCEEWATLGRCKRGCRCPLSNSHTMDNSPRYIEHRQPSPPEPSPPLIKPCRNWAATGKCQFGDRCRFAHSAPQPGARAITERDAAPDPGNAVVSNPWAQIGQPPFSVSPSQSRDQLPQPQLVQPQPQYMQTQPGQAAHYVYYWPMQSGQQPAFQPVYSGFGPAEFNTGQYLGQAEAAQQYFEYGSNGQVPVLNQSLAVH